MALLTLTIVPGLLTQCGTKDTQIKSTRKYATLVCEKSQGMKQTRVSKTTIDINQRRSYQSSFFFHVRTPQVHQK